MTKTTKASKTTSLATQPKAPTSALAIMKAASNAVTAGLEQMALLLSRDLNPGQAAKAYTLIDKEWKKPLEDIREMTRQGLLDLAREHGEEKKPGTKEYDADYDGDRYKIVARESRATVPDEAELTEYLLEMGIKPEKVFKPVVTTQLDKVELEKLMESGKLDRERVDAMRKLKSTSLIVTKE